MKNIFLETKNVMAFREAMASLEDVQKGQPGLAVVWGQAGRGKTVCAQEYAVHSRAIYLRVMEDWTPRAMLGGLCLKINQSNPRTIADCKQVICAALDVNPRLIIVDEADRLRNIGMIEHFRDIHDICGVPVVFIGEQSLYPKINSHRRLWSRVTQAVEFLPICSEDVVLFCLKAAGLRVSGEVAQGLCKRCDGDFRLIWQDVRKLENICRASGVAVVEMSMLKGLPNIKGGGNVN